MPSTRELRRRIKSVKATKQLTKALELVSASKMRRTSEAMFASRPYTDRMNHLIQDIMNRFGDSPISSPLLERRPVKNIVVVAIASDRGFAGVYNTAIIKRAHQFCEEQKSLGHSVSFITMGKKLESAFSRLGLAILQSYPHQGTNPHREEIWPISATVTDSFIGKKCDESYVLHTTFISLLRQETTMTQLLPFQTTTPTEPLVSKTEFIYEPSPEAVLASLLPRLVEVQLYQALLESLASEHAARRMAMKNATDNASDMIDDYTLIYNGLRQSAITQEIAEITSGAAALSS
jgi:F-type H+-transporting ATPase subunit gamma